MNAQRRVTEMLVGVWRRVVDGEYGVNDEVDLKAVTDDFTELVEELKYQGER